MAADEPTDGILPPRRTAFLRARGLRHRHRRRVRRATRRSLVAAVLAVLLVSGVAFAYWTTGSVPGGNGAAAATGVNAGSTPTAVVSGSAVTVSWAASTLTSGQAVSGYIVKRYSGAVVQTILSACTGTVAATSCVESSVPIGTWTYSVTPVFATSWQGAESAKSTAVVVTGNPVAVADGYAVTEDTSRVVAAAGVLSNDTDGQSDPLTAVLASGVANGDLTFNANGGFTYVPGVNFNGSDSFTYKANDGTLDSNIVTVTLTVAAVNDGPANIVPTTQQTPKNTDNVFSAATNNPISISDVDAGGATVQVQLTATNGTVTLPVLTGLTFTVGDGTSDATMTFTGTITTVNLRLDGATFIPTNNYTGAGALQIVTSDLGGTGTGGTLTDTDSVAVNVNAIGIFTANQDIGTTGPADPGTPGSSAYSAGTYTVAGGGSDIYNAADHLQYLSRTITGNGRLTARVVTDAQTPTASGSAKSAVMIRESTNAGSIQAMMGVMESNGTEFLYRTTTNGGSAYVGTPGPGIAAPYWLRITRNGTSITAERSVNGTTWVTETTQTITMTSTVYLGLAVSARDNTKLNTSTFDNVALSTPPTAVAESYSINEDTTLNVATRGVLANDTDPENNALTAIVVTPTSGLTLNANGSFAYVPPAGFSGAASFTYKANDGVFDSNTVTVNLTVNPANEVPSFTKGANQSIARNAGAQSVPGWASAISQGTGESGQLVDFVVSNDNNSLFTVQPAVSAAGALTYTPSDTGTGVVTVSVRIHDNGGTANGGTDTSAVQTFTITLTGDTTGPTGGSVDASGLVGTGSRYAASTTLSLTLAKGTDPAGVATTGNLLQRATSALTSGGTANGSCAAFGTYTTITGGTDPASPKSDTVADQACYSYRYVVLDTLGNATTYTSPDIKVDLTASAAPSLTHSAFTNTYWSSGAVVYYRPGAASGSFTSTATATDTASGIAGFTFPALGSNWTSTPGAAGVNTYSWSGAPAAPGAQSVTASNNAGLSSTATSFTPTADSTAPTAGTVTYADGSTSGTTVSVAFTTGTDSGSGVGTRLLQRAVAPATGSTCGSYGPFTTVTNGTNPTSPVVDSIADASCYKYQYVVADNVDNQHVATSPNVAHTAFGAYYAFNAGSGTTATDSTGNGNTATLQAGAGWTTGKIGTNALNLTGATNSFADVNREVIDSSKSYSVAGWVKLNNTSGFQTLASIDGTAISPFYLQIFEGVIQFTTRAADVTGSAATNVTGGTAVAGTWYHLAAVHDDAANTISLYVNGTLQSSTAFNSPWRATGHTVIGRAKWNGAPVDFVNGAIDEVRFYDRVLTAGEAATLADGTGPTGGSVAATGLVGTGSRYSTSTTVNLSLAKGTDPAGVATSGNQVLRATGTLSNGACSAYGTYTVISGGNDPGATLSDTVGDQACYAYKYVVSDTLGNSTTYVSGDIKVDLTGPTTPSLAFSAHTNAYGSGSTVYYRSAAASGSFTTTATATDTVSGIASYTFPAFGANWTSTPGSLGVNTYAWTGAPAAPGTKNVTATSNAAVTSANSPVTLTADDTAPTAGSVTPPNTTQASTTVSVAYTTGTDAGSGLGTRLLQRQSATLTGGTCGSYGGWTTASTNPGSSPFGDTVTTGFCYKYQYLVSDNVGNTHTATSGNVVKVTSPTVKAQYRNNDAAGPTNGWIQPNLQLVNTGASDVDLSTITIRYWFTKEAGASTFETPCYYADVGASNVTTSVVAVTPRTGADSYLLVGFQPSFTLAAGASSQVQLGLNKTDWSNFNEVDDYSYGTDTSYADSTKITVYQGGTLIWGTEP